MPVTATLVNEILAGASRAPSGVNSQPWQLLLLEGERAARLAADIAASAPALLQSPQAELFRVCGSLWPVTPPQAGLARAPLYTDEELLEQFRALDASAAAICLVDVRMGHGSHLDYGMFIRSAQLLGRARGIAVRVLPAWQLATEALRQPLGIEPNLAVIAALAFDEAPAVDQEVRVHVEWLE